MKSKVFLYFLLINIVFLNFICIKASEASKHSIELIVDFSQSIEGKKLDEKKISLTKEITLKILNAIDSASNIGLTLLGHKHDAKCGDKERLVLIKNKDRQKTRKIIREIELAGIGSIDIGIKAIFERPKKDAGHRSIILITSGHPTCDGDLLKTVRDIKDSYDYNVTFHIIAIDPSKADERKLKEIANIANGTFHLITTLGNLGEIAQNIAEKAKNPQIHTPKVVRLDDMVLIPEGEFLMGSTDKHYVDPNEHPAHTVYLDAYYIDRYEVTQKQFKDVMGYNPSLWIGSDLPVERVSWYEARDFCEKVGKRLPTEAEWEKAAKGGRNDRWAGTSIKEELVEYSWNDDTGAMGRTHPVGLKKPNGYGIYDMSGNVYEWVYDWFGTDYYKTSPKENPKGPEKGISKILRGGCWDNHTYEVRTTSRYARQIESKYANNGFRCAKSAK